MFPSEYVTRSLRRSTRQQHGDSIERELTDNSLASSPFLPLVSLGEAQRQQVERRASGQDDTAAILQAHGEALRRAQRHESFITNASCAGSPAAPSMVATPPARDGVSRLAPPPFGGRTMGDFIPSGVARRPKGSDDAQGHLDGKNALLSIAVLQGLSKYWDLFTDSWVLQERMFGAEMERSGQCLASRPPGR